MSQPKLKTEIVQKEKLDIYCSNCHFCWNLKKRKDYFNVGRLEMKLLLDLKYEPIETVAAFTLLAFLYSETKELKKASEYATKALCVLDIADARKKWSKDSILSEAFMKRAEMFNNNARKYVALSIYLHILFKIKDWKAMDDYFKEISTIQRELTDKDQCQILLIKGYTYKRISQPGEPEPLDCFVLAQSFDPDEPEAIFQEAICREKLRCINDNFISPLPQEERVALQKVISCKLWSNRIEYRAYPETLLITAELGNKLHQLLELEKQNGTHKLKNLKATYSEQEENYLHIKDYEEKISTLYQNFQPHFRYVNRAYSACLRAMKNLCFISIRKDINRSFCQIQSKIMEKALKNHDDDPTLTYQAGAFYLSPYNRNYYKAKLYFKKSMDNLLGNKWAEIRLLECEKTEHDIKLGTVQLLHKYKDSTDTKDRSGLYFCCAEVLKQFQNSIPEAKCYFLEAIKINPDNENATEKLLHLIGDTDNIEASYEKAEVYILSGLESKDYLEKAYSNIKRVYNESSTYQSVAMYYCQVLIYKFKYTKKASYLEEAMEIVNKNESQDDMIDLRIKIHMALAEISEESNTKLQNCVLAGRCGSIDGCKQSLALMKSLAEQNSQYFTSEEAYKCCAVVDLKLNTNHKVRNDAVQVEEISKRIRLLLKLDDSDLLTGNKDLLFFRRKRYEMCCSYEEIVGYNIGNDSKNLHTAGFEMAEEFFMLEAENILLFTRILLDRAFRTFCKKYYSDNIKGIDVYYPTLSEVPDSIDFARDDMLEYLHEKYSIEGFQSQFPGLLTFLAKHQKYIDGSKTINAFLLQYFQFSNYSKHEKSITSHSFMKQIKRLFPSCEDSPFLAFVQTACVYTEDVVSEFSKAVPSTTITTSDLLNDSAGKIQSVDQKHVVIFGDSFIENIGSKWDNKEFALRRVISDSNKSALECMVSVKEEDIYDVEYIVVQLGINDVLKETDKSVANLAWEVLPILNKFMQASNTNVKLLIGGVPEVKLPEPTRDGSKNNILSNFNEIVQKGCVFIPDTSFVANTKFHYGDNGHIVKDDDTSYKLTEKGKTLWIRNVLNRIKKMLLNA